MAMETEAIRRAAEMEERRRAEMEERRRAEMEERRRAEMEERRRVEMEAIRRAAEMEAIRRAAEMEAIRRAETPEKPTRAARGLRSPSRPQTLSGISGAFFTSEMLGAQLVTPNDQYGESGPNSAELTVDIPCDDKWHVWVRGVDRGTDDSFFIQIDEEPMNPAIFELDCDLGGGGGGYRLVWKELNYRKPNADLCEYLYDPWVQEWDKGEHELTFMARESAGIAEVVVTNKNNFDPS